VYYKAHIISYHKVLAYIHRQHLTVMALLDTRIRRIRNDMTVFTKNVLLHFFG